MNNPFHFSFLVKDIESTRKFYADILGCREGRSTSTWIDFDLYGNQLSAHVSNEVSQSFNCGFVDMEVVPIPHFGCIVSWNDFHEMAECFEQNKAEFILKPMIRFAGEQGEQATMFFKDFSGNCLEFKSFKNPDHIFTKFN